MTDSGNLTERLAARTLELCQIPSPIDEERALCDHLERWARARALAVRRFGNSLVIEGAQGARPLALVGHLDTVPSQPGDSPVRREGPRIYGRGSSDMKGGLAVAMALLEELPAERRPHAVFYEREEGPYAQNGLEPILAKGLLPKLALAVCLEPTDNKLQLGCVGSLHAKVRFRGKSAHSARPWQGENAIHKAAGLLSRLAAAERREVKVGELSFYEVMQVTQVAGGRGRNVVPDLVELNLNCRFAPGKTVEQAKAEVVAFVGASPGQGPELEFTDLSPSGSTCEHNPDVQRLRALGIAVEAKQAWTDVARFGVYGIDAVNFGPGQSAQAHQVDEWCDAPSLGLGYELLLKWLSQ